MIEQFKNFTVFNNENDPLRIDLVGETYCDKNFNIKRNCSDLNALEFIVDGSGTLDIENQHLEPQKNDVFFLKVGTNHTYKTDVTDRWHKLWVVFTGDFADSLIDCYLPKDTYLFKNCPELKNYFQEIFDISQQDILYEIMANKITVILVQIFMYIRNRSIIENEDLPDIIRRRLDAAVESDYNLEKLCKNINYSKNYIINVFKQKYKITPYQYFLERKIDSAKSYLVHTNASVGSISKILHYADQQYFSSSFKKAVGCSPLEYRRKSRVQ